MDPNGQRILLYGSFLGRQFASGICGASSVQFVLMVFFWTVRVESTTGVYLTLHRPVELIAR